MRILQTQRVRTRQSMQAFRHHTGNATLQNVTEMRGQWGQFPWPELYSPVIKYIERHLAPQPPTWDPGRDAPHSERPGSGMPGFVGTATRKHGSPKKEKQSSGCRSGSSLYPVPGESCNGLVAPMWEVLFASDTAANLDCADSPGVVSCVPPSAHGPDKSTIPIQAGRSIPMIGFFAIPW